MLVVTGTLVVEVRLVVEDSKNSIFEGIISVKLAVEVVVEIDSGNLPVLSSIVELSSSECDVVVVKVVLVGSLASEDIPDSGVEAVVNISRWLES